MFNKVYFCPILIYNFSKIQTKCISTKRNWGILQHSNTNALVIIRKCNIRQFGPGSSVGIAIYYGLDGPGIESRWGRDFSPIQTGPEAHTVSCKMGTRSFPGVKCGLAVLLTTHPLLVPRSWNSRAIPLPTLTQGHTRPVTGSLYLYNFIALDSV